MTRDRTRRTSGGDTVSPILTRDEPRLGVVLMRHLSGVQGVEGLPQRVDLAEYGSYCGFTAAGASREPAPRNWWAVWWGQVRAATRRSRSLIMALTWPFSGAEGTRTPDPLHAMTGGSGR
jgi:hypothetical protein